MKRFVGIIGIIMMLFMTGCGNKITTYTEVSYDEYSKLIEEKSNFILYIGSATCSHCLNFKPTLEEIIKEYQLDIKYIDMSKLSEKEYEIVKNKTKLQGTPTVVFVEHGIVKTSPKIQGQVPKSEALKKFKESGYIE